MIKFTKVAAIDIGSNAMRLLINDVIEHNEEKKYIKDSLIRVPVRLGTEVFTKGEISEESKERLIHSILGYKHLMIAHDVKFFRGCATSAMREAKNGKEIIKSIKQRTGIDIEIIDGQEEAAVIYANHIEKLIADENAYLYVDVGGGSTEITVINKGEIVAAKSFRIGTLRILNDMVNQQMWNELKTWLMNNIPLGKIDLIGSGGNINKVAKVSGKDLSKPVSYAYINKYFKELQKYNYEERIVKLDLKPDRADVIIPAMQIYTSIMRWTNATKIYIPKMGLADGIIKQLY